MILKADFKITLETMGRAKLFLEKFVRETFS
jgi:hypothetical protein